MKLPTSTILQPTPRVRLALAAVFASAVVTACGGGGSGGAVDPPAAAPPPVVAPGPPPPAAPGCDAVYGSAFTPVTGAANPPVPNGARPAKGQAFADPAFGTCMVRMTDHASEPPSGFARNDYSRRQAFNADSSLQLVYALDGFWHLYDTRTFAWVARLDGPAADAEPQWHPTDPRRLTYLPTNGVGMEVLELDVQTQQSRTVASLGSRLRALWPSAAAAWTRSEGSPSADGRYWCFMVDDARFNSVGIVTWDRTTDTLVGSLSTNGDRPDHLSMSPSGQHCVVSWNDGVVAFSRDFSQRRELGVVGEHSDLALDPSGDDLYVSVDYQANEGDVYMINLRTGVRTDLFPTYINGSATALHFSGKAFARPGWVLVSTYARNGGTGREWLHDKIFAVRLAPNPTIVQLAHTRAIDGGYWTEPHASVNRDFTKIAFTSNWGIDSDTDVDAFDIDLPRDLIR